MWRLGECWGWEGLARGFPRATATAIDVTGRVFVCAGFLDAGSGNYLGAQTPTSKKRQGTKSPDVEHRR